MSIRTAIVRHPIDVAAMLAEIQDSANGATVLFLGHVREVNDDRAVTGIEYSAYGEMAERELASIANDAVAATGVSDL
ncbi:MAG TPA: molybdenum cofactor biosynthesis protein MoaE, partial [Gemmatimonadaceae bacterium]|nr:molybdenum cofactor biosynthesis protein MoaE [Gemmatimonadaceae bacterium]